MFACSEQGVTRFNASPDAVLVSHDDGQQVDAGVEIGFIGSGSDPDHDESELLASWFVDDVEVCAPTALQTGGNTLCTVTLSEGERRIRLTVEDPQGASDSDSIAVQAVAEPPPNEAPTCTITAPEDNAFGELGATLELAAQVADAEDAPSDLDITWTSDQDGALGTSTADASGQVSFSAGDLSDATHVITLRVVDSAGDDCSDQVHYSVGSPPTLSIVSPSQGDVYDEGEEIPFTARVTDGQDASTELVVDFSTDVTDALASLSPSSGVEVSFSRSDLAWGAYTLTVRVTDTDGLYSEKTVDFTVNGLPSQPTIHISPDGATTDDNLRVEFDTEATDPEGGSVSYSYAWSVDGSAYGSSSSVSAAATSKHDVWSVLITPSDDQGSEGPAASATLTIANSPPQAPEVSIDPSSPLPEESLRCAIDADSPDADGDSVSYSATWTVDGAAFTGTTSLHFSGDTVPSGETNDGETWACTVVPDDGDDVGASSGASVTVECEKHDWYDDVDMDGYGDPAALTAACEQPSGTVDNDEDCDDGAADINPDATEWCDGVDNDCDGDTDENNAADASTWYADADADGFGDASVASHACSQPVGYVADSSDCDDGDANIYPWAYDVYGDGVDNDCDGLDCEADWYGAVYFSACFDDLGWHDGRAACQAAGHDDLASVLDAGEQAFLESLIQDAGLWSSQAPWIGFADEVVESYWGWADGSATSYTNWGSGEPNGGTSEDCAQLNWPLASGQWNDADCYDTSADKGYVCELR